MANGANDMTPQEWAELDRLCRKAAWDSTTTEQSKEILLNVSAYASRLHY